MDAREVGLSVSLWVDTRRPTVSRPKIVLRVHMTMCVVYIDTAHWVLKAVYEQSNVR